MGSDDDDLDFTALMRRQGVEPVAGKQAAKKAARAGASTGEGRGAARTGEAVRAVAGAGPVVGRGAGKRVGATAVAAVRVEKSVGRVEKSVGRGEKSVGREESLARELELLKGERDEVVVQRDALVLRVKVLEQEAAVGRRAVEVAEAMVVTQRAELARRVAVVPEVARVSLAAALVGRGLREGEEQARAVAVLMGTESAGRVLAMLESREVEGLRSALERRLALVCGSQDCQAIAGGAMIEVEPARCELCGGSEIQRAAGRFMRACEAAGIRRVRFVGGSPNYRTQLEALFPGGGSLTVRTTAGDQRVSLSRAKAQQRGDDLVIIWGATELDHATSGAYRAQFGRVEVVAHRGIGRMLDLAAERITQS